MTNFEVFWICSFSCPRLTLPLMPDFNLGGRRGTEEATMKRFHQISKNIDWVIRWSTWFKSFKDKMRMKREAWKGAENIRDMIPDDNKDTTYGQYYTTAHI